MSKYLVPVKKITKSEKNNKNDEDKKAKLSNTSNNSTKIQNTTVKSTNGKSNVTKPINTNISTSKTPSKDIKKTTKTEPVKKPLITQPVESAPLKAQTTAKKPLVTAAVKVNKDTKTIKNTKSVSGVPVQLPNKNSAKSPEKDKNGDKDGLLQDKQNDLYQPSLKPRKRELKDGGAVPDKREVKDKTGLNTTNLAEKDSVKSQVEKANESSNAPVKTVQELVATNDQLINDCMNIIIQCDPKQECSKDELISRITYQRNMQLKQNGGVKNKAVIAMDKILSDLRNEQITEGVKNMKETRQQQDTIVRANEMDEDVYKMKIDLTLPENRRKLGDDPHCTVLKESKSWWSKESKKTYVAPPKLEAAFKTNPGNKVLPRELAKQLIGY
jgi:hypothetical protein